MKTFIYSLFSAFHLQITAFRGTAGMFGHYGVLCDRNHCLKMGCDFLLMALRTSNVKGILSNYSISVHQRPHVVCESVVRRQVGRKQTSDLLIVHEGSSGIIKN